jgi:hypothetical protein
MAKALTTVDDDIREVMSVLRSIKEARNEIEAEIGKDWEKGREKLRNLLEQKGSEWTDGEGYARIAAGYTTIEYDTAALDALIKADPERYGPLQAFRKEKQVKGSLQIK